MGRIRIYPRNRRCAQYRNLNVLNCMQKWVQSSLEMDLNVLVEYLVHTLVRNPVHSIMQRPCGLLEQALRSSRFQMWLVRMHDWPLFCTRLACHIMFTVCWARLGTMTCVRTIWEPSNGLCRVCLSQMCEIYPVHTHFCHFGGVCFDCCNTADAFSLILTLR